MRLKFRQLCITAALFGATVFMSAQDTANETVNVVGTWTVSTQGQRGSRTQKMTLQQDGSKISGSIQGDRGSNELQGSVEGSDIRFTVSMNTPRGAMTFEYRGRVEGASMKGTIQGPMSGSWSANREAE
jgi:hypothetical protein